MKSKNSSSIRAAGQRSIYSTFKIPPSNPCATRSNSSDGLSDCKKRGSNLSLAAFLNRKLHTTSVIPTINKDKDTFSAVEEENICQRADHNPLDKSILKDKQCNMEGAHDERGRVIEDSVFKLFNDSREKVRKRSSETITASRFKSDSRKQSQNRLLVLGDDPKPKKRAHGEALYSSKKPRPVYNHYENGTGWWEPEREGVDNDEVGSIEIWEGRSSTTLGGLDWH